MTTVVTTNGADADDQADPAPSSAALNTERTIRRVGGQIRRLRAARGLKLQDVADRTGVSVSMLSMLERGVAGGSIGTLVAVSSALGVHMSDLFEHEAEEKSPVRRLADQVQVETAAGVLRRLAHHDEASGLEMVVNEYAPGTSSGARPVHHAGTEYGIVIEGELVVEVEGIRHELITGDGITYASGRPHLIRNEGSRTARAVWVNLGA
ncbi:cupin domain-containing protein [Geodermatophilus sp. DF01-2]|uniref:helix-turn-helix domain-containing protein n=1 Tax=Geodermatophilus sp. DF01-2 TaxID=2559610 RepID=UPI00107407CF|nr:XRE family transcriptional regulator [Geodermatophilus sp. DF01_2]TFV56065.1 cupin domain-containing protein [Geodermatophilus sp. DF01_2]